MKKIKIDGLLALNLEEIEIVYRRCKGETVKEIAQAMNIGQSTIYNTKMPAILTWLEVDSWDDVESELCKPLRKIILSVSSLKSGWPEAFREKIESLRESIETPEAKEPPPATPQSTNPTGSQPTASRTDEENRRPIWIFVATPILVLCLLCGASVVFAWPLIQNILAPEVPTDAVTETPEPLVPPTSTTEPSPTLELTATQPAIPTATMTPTLTLTLTATVTPPPSETKSPIGLGIGDELRDDRVTLKLIDVRYNEGYDRVGARIAPVSYFFEYTNHSGGPLVVQFDKSNFVIEDNTGRTAECWFFLSPFTAFEEWNSNLNDNATVLITARCGLGRLPQDVTSHKLTIHPFTSLPESRWDVEVPR